MDFERIARLFKSPPSNVLQPSGATGTSFICSRASVRLPLSISFRNHSDPWK